MRQHEYGLPHRGCHLIRRKPSTNTTTERSATACGLHALGATDFAGNPDWAAFVGGLAVAVRHTDWCQRPGQLFTNSSGRSTKCSPALGRAWPHAHTRRCNSWSCVAGADPPQRLCSRHGRQPAFRRAEWHGAPCAGQHAPGAQWPQRRGQCNSWV